MLYFLLNFFLKAEGFFPVVFLKILLSGFDPKIRSDRQSLQESAPIHGAAELLFRCVVFGCNHQMIDHQNIWRIHVKDSLGERLSSANGDPKGI